ncbi:MAG: phosphoglycerate kinase [Candidatus Lloydbacteria bacterium RIFCSPHIGHO2_01_FULL_49_22]|uniref:Phosphoglycerate kinase n=1 Tax=Candidatus Lloydbacteria bacterium RIFCSPHIGHO2_01_FULL_49_22 TaxID=1798658 RepID=A0A1G2CY05_9BACT|nr:MAG: phosphoglycerate kinase [Candidatus Lloydbacteria bacterium RIFCSPHIGHO2_01_FULL_49_22]OGZ09336.1 MAG: phosphoglycerate kinase [Candidatus Lloydbacteria bacterium RIFCSPHIGHO2_02_FULL_50_18]
MIILPHVTDASDLSGKRVLLRLDLNVPIEGGEIRDPYRIEKSLQTLNYLRAQNARIVIISHIGKGDPEDTLAPVARYLNTKFPTTFLSRLESSENERLTKEMEDGDVVIVENLRHSKGEEKNDSQFAAYLATLGDVYVNDAFSVSHRAHASVVGVPALLPHYAGIQIREEVERIAVAFKPARPFLFIVGGAKISTKMPLLKKFIGIADHIFVGGANVNNLLKSKGYEIGTSVYDKDVDGDLTELLESNRLILPIDVVVKNDAGSEVRPVNQVNSGDMIVDIGPETIKYLEGVVGSAQLIVWNGPLGFYEQGFTEATRELISLVSGSRATSLVGGGDTVALIDEMGAIDNFSFVSTGGGAMLDFLANETLPGIEALQK